MENKESKRTILNKILMIVYVFLNTLIPFAVVSLILYTSYVTNVEMVDGVQGLFWVVFFSLMIYPALFVIPSYKISVKNFPKDKYKSFFYVGIFLMDFLFILLFLGHKEFIDSVVQYSLNTYSVVLFVTILNIFIKDQAKFLRQKRKGKIKGVVSSSVIFILFLIPVLITYIFFLEVFLEKADNVSRLYPFFYIIDKIIYIRPSATFSM